MYIFKIIKNTFYKKVIYKKYIYKYYILNYWVLKKIMYTYLFKNYLQKSVNHRLSGYPFSWGTSMDGDDIITSEKI